MAKNGKVKTHTFKLGKYHIDICGGVQGLCDVPDRDNEAWRDTRKEMTILEGNTLEALEVATHESFHAEDIPEKFTHRDSPERIAKFLWRLGWRKRQI